MQLQLLNQWPNLRENPGELLQRDKRSAGKIPVQLPAPP
jgi:hypothetical protein